MGLDGGSLTIALTFEDDLVEIVDRVEIEIIEIAGFGLDVTRHGNVAGENRFALAHLEEVPLFLMDRLRALNDHLHGVLKDASNAPV